jgi:uncharacterized protein (TIGR00369 family)
MDKDTWINNLLRFFDKAPIKRTIGMELSFDEESNACIKIEFNPRICHAYGDIHGGIYALAIDTAMWFTLSARYPGIWLATIEMHTYILKSARQSTINAMGKAIHTGKRSAIGSADVFDDEGNRIAYGTGTFIVLPEVKISVDDAERKIIALYERFKDFSPESK